MDSEKTTLIDSGSESGTSVLDRDVGFTEPCDIEVSEQISEQSSGRESVASIVSTESTVSAPVGRPRGAAALLDRLRGRRSGVQPDRRFLAVAPDANNLAVLLECVYTARLLKKRHQKIHAAILAHPCNAALLRLTAVFDEVLELATDDQWRQRILDFGPDVLYLPDQGLRAHLATLFTGAKVRIGGTRHRLISKLLRFHKINHEEDLKRLKRRGFDLFPELTDLQILGTLSADHLALPSGDFAVLSLFDAHDLTSGWPVGHAARLARQMQELNLRLVVPLPATIERDGPGVDPESRRRLVGEIAFLKKNVDVTVIADCLPADRAAAMMAAKIVIGPAGPETILASILKKPVVVLHDMKTFRNHPGHVRPPGLHEIRDDAETGFAFADSKAGSNSLLKSSLSVLREQAIPLTSYYIKLADSLERHIMPAVDVCIKDCPTCSFQSCVEYISPERVFEQLKKIVLPF